MQLIGLKLATYKNKQAGKVGLFLKEKKLTRFIDYNNLNMKRSWILRLQNKYKLQILCQNNYLKKKIII